MSYKAARINAGITQKDAADNLGITQGTLLSYEKGYREPKADMLRRMSELELSAKLGTLDRIRV